MRLEDLTNARKIETREFLKDVVLKWPKSPDGWRVIPTQGYSPSEAQQLIQHLNRAIDVTALEKSGSSNQLNVKISESTTTGYKIPAHVKITPFGELILEDKAGSPDQPMRENECFVIMPFNKPDTEQVWAQVYEPVIREAGLDVVRIDVEEDGTLVHAQIFDYLRHSGWIIADLTHRRPNCYMEVGFAYGAGKFGRTILCCRRGQKIHFDLGAFNVLPWSPDNLGKFREQLASKLAKRRAQTVRQISREDIRVVSIMRQDSIDDVLRKEHLEAKKWQKN